MYRSLAQQTLSQETISHKGSRNLAPKSLWIALAVAMGGLLLWPMLGPHANAYADERARDIMKTVYAEGRKHATQQSNVFLLIRDAKDRERTRYFTHRRLNETQEMTKSLIRFYRPPNVSGTALLTHSDDSKEDNSQWVYFPAFKTVKQLSAENKNESFMGSDFSYADIAGRQLDQDTHTLLKETDKYYYIRSVPKRSTDQYSKLDLVINRKLNVPRRIVFYDGKGTKLKTLNNKKINQVQGMYVVTNAVMENHQTKGSSTLDVSDIKVGIPISQNDVGILALKTN